MRLIHVWILVFLLVACGRVQDETNSQIAICAQMATREPLRYPQDGCAKVQIHNAIIKQRQIKDVEGSLLVEVPDTKQKYYLGIKKSTAIFMLQADQTSRLVNISAIRTGQIIDVLIDKDGVRLSNPAQANAEEILIK